MVPFRMDNCLETPDSCVIPNPLLLLWAERKGSCIALFTLLAVMRELFPNSSSGVDGVHRTDNLLYGKGLLFGS